VSGEFAGYPIQIAHLLEYYPKRKENQHQECWIVTTDLTLLPEEIREAAHLRWRIENNEFYAAHGIKAVMPTVELCRVVG